MRNCAISSEQRRFLVDARKLAQIGVEVLDVAQPLVPGQQILDVEQPHETAGFRVADRIARVAAGAHLGQYLVDRLAYLDPRQVRERPHDVSHQQIVELEAVHEETRLDRTQLTMLMAGEQHASQLLGRMHGVGPAGRLYAHPANDRVGGAVENVDERIHHPVKYVERQRRPERHRLGLADCHRLGRLLAQHDVEVGNERECDRRRRCCA